ncbi:MAG: type II secretion system protein GspM [Pseudomonadales bacterium]
MLENLRDQLAALFSGLYSSTATQRVVTRYRGLSERDQKALQLLSLFALCVAIFYGILKPAKNYMDDAQHDYVNETETLNWMEERKSQFLASDSDALAQRGDQSLLSLASNTARAFGMSFRRFEPVDDDALRLWIDNVNFNDIVQWIEVLDQSYNITLREMTVDQSAQNGLVVTKLVLQE